MRGMRWQEGLWHPRYKLTGIISSLFQVTSGMKIVVIVALCLSFFGIQVDCKVSAKLLYFVPVLEDSNF